jgi:hypothetical protein
MSIPQILQQLAVIPLRIRSCDQLGFAINNQDIYTGIFDWVAQLVRSKVRSVIRITMEMRNY